MATKAKGKKEESVEEVQTPAKESQPNGALAKITLPDGTVQEITVDDDEVSVGDIKFSKTEAKRIGAIVELGENGYTADYAKVVFKLFGWYAWVRMNGYYTSITTELIKDTPTELWVHTTVKAYDPNNPNIPVVEANGWASSDRKGEIDARYGLENAETSSVGRALSKAGVMLETWQIESAERMREVFEGKKMATPAQVDALRRQISYLSARTDKGEDIKAKIEELGLSEEDFRNTHNIRITREQADELFNFLKQIRVK